ncbi:MAG: hypothetical protein ACLPSL_00455 [Smithella sp.]
MERGSAKLTIAAYSSDLAQFSEFLERRGVGIAVFLCGTHAFNG